jgi:hypothetical protein
MFLSLYPLKPAPAIVRDERQELGVFGGALEVTPMHCAAVSVPRRQLVVVPTIQNPPLHVGWHDDWLDRLALHVPSVPPVGAETAHGVSEHAASVLYQDSDSDGQSAVNPAPPHTFAPIQFIGVPGVAS